MKKYKAIEILWAVSLVVISIVTVLLSVASIAGFDLPKALRITCGVLDIVAVVVLVFTSVKKFIVNKRKDS